LPHTPQQESEGDRDVPSSSNAIYFRVNSVRQVLLNVREKGLSFLWLCCDGQKRKKQSTTSEFPHFLWVKKIIIIIIIHPLLCHIPEAFSEKLKVLSHKKGPMHVFNT